MWTDLNTHQFGRRPEENPRLGHYIVTLLMIAAVFATLIAMYVALHAPLFR